MNHLVRNENTPDEENKIEYVECKHCLGMGEEFEPDDEEGITGNMIPCRVCNGQKEVPRSDDYNEELDYLDDRADEAHDEDVFFKDDER